MLNPIEMPLPLAMAFLAALVYAATLIRTSLTVAAPRPAPAPPTATGRHRLAAAATPYRPRPWADLRAERQARLADQLAAQERAAIRDFEQVVFCAIDDTRELAVAR